MEATARDPFGVVGTTVAGHYAVEALVAERSFSVVYSARHTLSESRVAIKAIRGCEALRADAREKLARAFAREGAILADLSERTTAIGRARDASTLFAPNGDRVPCLVLDWLEGKSLKQVLGEERRMALRNRTMKEAATLLDPIAHALMLAHAKGICHLDVNPANLTLVGDGRGRSCTIKLLHFGVASFFCHAQRAMSDGREPLRACGFSPSYSAPEQFSDGYGITGPWTDVFALALLVGELVSGCAPLGEGTPDALARSAVDPNRRPTPRTLGADVSDRVEEVMARALTVFPVDRWQTAGSFWGALGEATAPPSVLPPQPYLARGRAAAARSVA